MVTVLVVDDTALERRRAGALLEKRADPAEFPVSAELQVLYAANGKEALLALDALLALRPLGPLGSRGACGARGARRPRVTLRAWRTRRHLDAVVRGVDFDHRHGALTSVTSGIVSGAGWS